MSQRRGPGQYPELNGSAHDPQHLRRSPSFLGTITSFVTGPLKTWMSSAPPPQQESTPKRSLAVANGNVHPNTQSERIPKRPRLHSPPPDHHTNPSSQPSQKPWPMNTSTAAFPRAYAQPNLNGATPMPSPLPSSLKRANTLILDSGHEGGPSNKKRSNMSLDPVIRATSRDASMHNVGSSPRRSISRDPSLGLNGPPSPYRIRASLTPQPSMSSSPVHREFSIPRSSIIWPSGSPRTNISPVRDTRRESSAPLTRRPLMWDAKMGITTNDDLHKQKGRSMTPAPSTPSERALQALESFKRPLIPPSFAGEPDAERLLASRRKYAPPPLPPSVVQSSNSLSPTSGGSTLKGKTARMVRPYGGEGGMKKLLRRRAEELGPLKRAGSPLKDTATQTDSEMSSEPPSSPLQGKAATLSRRATVENCDDDNPFTPKPLSRKAYVENCDDDDELDLIPRRTENRSSEPPRPSVQAKEFGGRVSASRAAAPSRPTNPNAPSTGPLRTERRKNRFAARFDDDEPSQEDVDPALAGLPTKEELMKASAVGFDVPSGFSFRAPAGPLPTIPEDKSSRPSVPAVASAMASTPRKASGFGTQPPKPNVSLNSLVDMDSPSPFSFVPTPESSKVTGEKDTPPAPSPFSFPPPPTVSSSSDSDKDKPIGALPFSFASSRPTTPASSAPSGSLFAPLGTSSQENTGVKPPEKQPTASIPAFTSPAAVSYNVPSLGLIPPTPQSLFSSVSNGTPLVPQVPSPVRTPALNASKQTEPQNPFTRTTKAPSLFSSPDLTSGPLGNSGEKSSQESPLTPSAPSSSLYGDAGKAPTNVFGVSGTSQSSSGVVINNSFGTKTSALGPGQPSNPVSTAPQTKSTAEGTESVETPKPLFPGFNFGATNTSSKPELSFGVSGSTLPSSNVNSSQAGPQTNTPLNFGAKPTETKSPFAFGAPPSTPPSNAERNPFATSNNATQKPGVFSFSNPAAVDSRPKTPENPPSTDQMDLSPTREPAKPSNAYFNSGAGSGFSAPATGGFSFSPSKADSAPGPFSFSAPSTSNVFGNKTNDKPPSTTAFGFSNTGPTTPTAVTPFSFGAQAPKPESERGASPFGFSAPVAPATPFGAPSSNPFSSPLQASQPLQNDSRASTPFTFNTPTPSGQPSNPFNFGSQPSSPAASPGGLPQVNGGGAAAPFVFGAGPNAAESAAFTIGAAPPGQRTTKGLPRRRTTTGRK